MSTQQQQLKSMDWIKVEKFLKNHFPSLTGEMKVKPFSASSDATNIQSEILKEGRMNIS